VEGSLCNAEVAQMHEQAVMTDSVIMTHVSAHMMDA